MLPVGGPGKPERNLKTQFTKGIKAGLLDMDKVLGPLIAEFKKEHGITAAEAGHKK